MSYDINSQQIDIENLFKQNENDLCSIKELYRKLKEMEKKISQIKYIDTNLTDKLKKDYEKLKRVILDENIQIQLTNDINEINSQLDTKANDIIGISVKNFGAKGDGITDDTQALKKAFSSNAKIITMDCDCKISSTLTLPIDKKYIFKGSFIVDDNFHGNSVVSITNVVEGFKTEKISIIHNKFYKKDRHSVSNTKRTNFDGVVISNSRRVNIGEIQVVGITTRALVVNDGYETHIDKIDVWGSNLTDDVSVNTNYDDKLMFTSQNERYTVGIVLNCNDGFFNNVIPVGFNVGCSINSSNVINNFHPWGYKSSMVYGLVNKGALNMCTNIYIDTIKTIGTRTGAGVYDWKIADGNTSGSTNIEYNKFTNISAINVDSNSVIFELGDSEKKSTSYECTIQNINGQYGITLYKLNGSAKGLTNLPKLFGNDFNIFSTSITNLKFTSSNSFNQIIGEIIDNHFNTVYNYMCSMVFRDTNKVLTSKLPTTSAVYNQQAIIKIEQCTNSYYRCTVRGYGWPNSNSYILDLFRKGVGSYDFFANNSSFYKIVNTLPNADEYGVGNMMFYKNRPIWKSSSGYWVYADGTNVV